MYLCVKSSEPLSSGTQALKAEKLPWSFLLLFFIFSQRNRNLFYYLLNFNFFYCPHFRMRIFKLFFSLIKKNNIWRSFFKTKFSAQRSGTWNGDKHYFLHIRTRKMSYPLTKQSIFRFFLQLIKKLWFKKKLWTRFLDLHYSKGSVKRINFFFHPFSPFPLA